ncbi:MAG TPA: carboxypeptidase-like regulatory domain-containing protein, partial [Puia sp.]|nr:carboxypeptidase-like regulatory domain-containing protein [Puia sp.]
MRTSAVLFMMVCCAAHLLIAAPGRGQDRTKRNITLEYHNAPFTTVVKAIEQRTGLIIMYELTPDLEKDRVSISVSGRPASEALDLLVHGRLLKWSLKESENIVRLERSDAAATISANAAPLPPDPPRLTGIVKDDKGRPLAGATIAIRNSRTFATTNAEGVFSIQAKEGDIIICTFVSCEPRTIRVSADMLHLGSLGQIMLIQSVSGLDETV